MRRISMTLAAVSVCIAGVAQAQTPAAPALSRRYAEFAVGPTFGHRSDVSFGVEGGIPINESFDVFAEGGRMRNVSTSDLDAAAAVVAQYIGGTGSAKQSVGYFDVGVRYLIPTTFQIEPYVSLGVGAAKVTRSATFAVGGTDVTSQLLDRFGVQLGGDLSETETKALLAFGLGAHFNVSKRLIGDISYRYGRIFLVGQGLNTNRLSFGVGVRF
jgi:opacity protein-like surface antigen